MIHLYDFTYDQLCELLQVWNVPQAHARRLWNYLYRELVTSFAAMDELPAKLRARLDAEATLTQLAIARQTAADDGRTNKYLLRLHNGQQIETVQMVYAKGSAARVTACLSSQVGCALGCVFCATGQLGFTRNLSAGEIVAQALHVARSIPGGERLGNLVLMGMGEPLLNYDAVLTALDILHDSGGLAIGAKQITISTVGVIPGIVRLADEGRKYSLAVSLHAATQQERLALIPAAGPWPLDELLAACRYYTSKLQQKIFFEWTLIAGSNDSPETAQELAALLRDIPAQVNLIPLNPTAGFAGEPGQAESIVRFREVLRANGIPSSVRQRRGIDIAAGCGQLAGAS
jgi:23S rRNA (adenine2503-C2)-methyltransferase